MAGFVIQRGLAGHIPAGLSHHQGHAAHRHHVHWVLRPHTTPGKVTTLTALAVVLTGGLATVAAVAFGGLGQGLGSIGGPDAAEVNATTGLYFSLNDMDAQVANVLMTGAVPALARTGMADIAVYGRDRAAANADLEAAAGAGPGNPAAQRGLRAVLDGLGQYEALTADALLSARAPRPWTGAPPAVSVAYYRRATDLMRASILPQVTTLTQAGSGRLGSTYLGERAYAWRAVAGVAVTGILLTGVLVTLQVFLAVRFRRLVSPALALATLVAAGATVAAAVQLGGEARSLEVAKASAFDSVLALTQARAVSYDANADESRYLIDPSRALGYEQSFIGKSERVEGYLAAEMRNITFPGERAAAERTLSAYQAYLSADQRLRALSGTSLAAAIAFDTGTAPGQSDWYFSRYDAALSALTAINTRAFSAAVAAGEADAGPGSGAVPAACAIAACALTILGVRPRLAEYR